jgi:hypothetical protein
LQKDSAQVTALQTGREHALNCTVTVDLMDFGTHSAHAGQERLLDVPAEVE